MRDCLTHGYYRFARCSLIDIIDSIRRPPISPSRTGAPLERCVPPRQLRGLSGSIIVSRAAENRINPSPVTCDRVLNRVAKLNTIAACCVLHEVGQISTQNGYDVRVACQNINSTSSDHRCHGATLHPCSVDFGAPRHPPHTIHLFLSAKAPLQTLATINPEYRPGMAPASKPTRLLSLPRSRPGR